MKPTLKEILEAALDALWELHGNGYGTEQERLIAELQMEISRHNANVEARRDGAPLPEKTSTPLPRTSC
jgi:hypothetical protein